MYIVFCREVSSMGKRFEDHSEGVKDMGNYVAECLKLYPKSEVKIQKYI